MGRAIRSLIGIHLALGVAFTLVTEVITWMQGSSRVIGAVNAGASKQVVTSAVVKFRLMPIVTWPTGVAQWALRGWSARG